MDAWLARLRALPFTPLALELLNAPLARNAGPRAPRACCSRDSAAMTIRVRAQRRLLRRARRLRAVPATHVERACRDRAGGDGCVARGRGVLRLRRRGCTHCWARARAGARRRSCTPSVGRGHRALRLARRDAAEPLRRGSRASRNRGRRTSSNASPRGEWRAIPSPRERSAVARGARRRSIRSACSIAAFSATSA